MTNSRDARPSPEATVITPRDARPHTEPAASRESDPAVAPNPFPEVERYELSAGPTYRFDLRRRDFLKVMGGGVVVVLAVPGLGVLGEAEAAVDPARAGPDGAPMGPLPGADDELVAAWLHIGEEGTVTAFTGKVEVGQDIRTSLTQAVADELRVGPDAVRLVMGDTGHVPWDMGTFGSRTTPQMASQLRRAGATLREILKARAAEEWGVAAAGLRVEEGRVSDPASGHGLSLGELAARGDLEARVDSDAPVTPPERWEVAGHSLPKVDGRDMVTGRHRYTSDLDFPDMLHGRVLRPPAIGAELLELDASDAEGGAGGAEGVVVVRDGDFVGVAASDGGTSERALGRLRARWSDPPTQASHREIFRHLREHSAPGGGRGSRARGSLSRGLAEAERQIEAVYTAHYIAHVPMEPRAAVARWEEGEDGRERLTVWTATQRPFGVREELARAFRLDEERVRVIHPDAGGAYGGKHTGETAVEAARLARASGGRPVKLVWTRQEEFDWAYFRPAGVMELRAGAAADGRLTAWEHHNHNSGTAGLATPYEVPNERAEFHAVDSPLRQGSYRALAAVANNFARESAMDELAHALGMDPLAFRLRNLSDERLRAVLEAAAERFGWEEGVASDRALQGGSAPADSGTRFHGRGIACGFEKGGYVATCAEVSLGGADGEVRVERAVTAFECGAVVNPDHLRSQVEGCVVMGLGGALFERIDFEDGRVLNGRLADYRVPRFRDLPRMETVLLDRPDLPSAGAGEAPIIAIAPAIAGAIFEATGERRRGLPLGADASGSVIDRP